MLALSVSDYGFFMVCHSQHVVLSTSSADTRERRGRGQALQCGRHDSRLLLRQSLRPHVFFGLRKQLRYHHQSPASQLTCIDDQLHTLVAFDAAMASIDCVDGTISGGAGRRHKDIPEAQKSKRCLSWWENEYSDCAHRPLQPGAVVIDQVRSACGT